MIEHYYVIASHSYKKTYVYFVLDELNSRICESAKRIHVSSIAFKAIPGGGGQQWHVIYVTESTHKHTIHVTPNTPPPVPSTLK